MILTFTEHLVAVLAQHGLPVPPGHPETGEPFVSVSLEARQEMQTYRCFEPSHPSREVVTEWAYDPDDGDEYAVTWRELDDAEWAEALAAYERARAAWRRTMGTARVVGPRTYRARFETASGSYAEGATTDGASEWCWLEVGCRVGAS
jgi:hypothetical protein